jgi:anti-anti-sigma factor
MAVLDDHVRGAVALVHCVPGTELDRVTARSIGDDLHRWLTQDVIGSETAIDTVVLDLSTITIIDSVGLATLLRFKATLTGLGLRLRLASPSDPVRRTIEAVGLDRRLGLGETADLDEPVRASAGP